MTAKDILDIKGRAIYSIIEEATIHEAISELIRNKIGFLVVNNSMHSIAGLLSERDIVKKCVYLGKNPVIMKVKEIMTTTENVVVSDEKDDIQSLMNTMTEKRIRHLPIFRGKDLVGVISIGDIIKNLLEIKEYEIKTLMDYISGRYPG